MKSLNQTIPAASGSWRRATRDFTIFDAEDFDAFQEAWEQLTGETPAMRWELEMGELMGLAEETAEKIAPEALAHWRAIHRIPQGNDLRPLPCRIIDGPGFGCAIAQLIDDPADDPHSPIPHKS